VPELNGGGGTAIDSLIILVQIVLVERDDSVLRYRVCYSEGALLLTVVIRPMAYPPIFFDTVCSDLRAARSIRS
jgi:hypothetical protein